MSSVADLVSMCSLQAITPAVREAISALARGDRKGNTYGFYKDT